MEEESLRMAVENSAKEKGSRMNCGGKKHSYS